ncbi:MAG: anti-sigma factor antagonist [Clostridia bacterium]|nr:anti-sigma factor antagonist [Clostridia bacterium]
MTEVTYSNNGNSLTIALNGHIDSANAAAVEAKINEIRSANPADGITVNCENLIYISSAGLRIVLRLKKAVPDTKLINVSPDVYEIFDMTGFTEIMEIHKAYRLLSVEGCEVIGQGANGKVYRIDKDTIVKVYMNPDSLAEIHRERELARTAFVLGVPTAIPYDVVRIEGGGYGSVFELLNATSFAKLLSTGEKTVDEIAEMSIKLLKTIHSTVVKSDSLPDITVYAKNWVDFLKDHLPENLHEKLKTLVTSIPSDNRMLHGDFHIKNVLLQNGESILIDMDTLCHGHPVFELAGMYNAYVGFSDIDHDNVLNFLGISYETAGELWRKMLRLYFNGESEEKIAEIEKKAMVIGYARILRRAIRLGNERMSFATEVAENCKKRLAKLLPEIDDLTF